MKPFCVRTEGISHEEQQELLDLAVDAGAIMYAHRECSRHKARKRSTMCGWFFFGVNIECKTQFADKPSAFGPLAVEITHEKAWDYLQSLIDEQRSSLSSHEHAKPTPTAIGLLNKGVGILDQRVTEYEKDGNQERSFDSVAAAFNAITGKDLTPAEIALVLQCVKDVRQWSQDRLHEDSVIDGINYAALKGELLYKQYGEEE